MDREAQTHPIATGSALIRVSAGLLFLRRQADATDLNQVRVPRQLLVLICVSHLLCLSLLNAMLPQILLFKMLIRVRASARFEEGTTVRDATPDTSDLSRIRAHTRERIGENA